MIGSPFSLFADIDPTMPALAVLVDRLGGEVEISDGDLMGVQRGPDGRILTIVQYADGAYRLTTVNRPERTEATS